MKIEGMLVAYFALSNQAAARTHTSLPTLSDKIAKLEEKVTDLTLEHFLNSPASEEIVKYWLDREVGQFPTPSWCYTHNPDLERKQTERCAKKSLRGAEQKATACLFACAEPSIKRDKIDWTCCIEECLPPSGLCEREQGWKLSL